MATVGQPLTAPEAGWQRIDDVNATLAYTGFSAYTGQSGYYLGTVHENTSAGATIKFNFTGTRLRVIGRTQLNSSTNISIDGAATTPLATATYSTAQTLIYESPLLEDKEHYITITVTTTYWLDFDAIDIDSSGSIKAYNTNYVYLNPSRIKTSLSSMQVGDVIPCRYSAPVSGTVGSFSELGTCVSTEIPFASSATPDGLFYFIHAGYDSKNRMKLIADRNIQHTISWDTLNTKGITSGDLDANISSINATASYDSANAWKAFEGIVGDNNNTSQWYTNGVASSWLQADYNDYGTFNSFTLISGDATQAPTTIIVKGSNTGSFSGEEVELFSSGTLTWTVNNGTWGGSKTFTLNNPSNYRYIRYYFTKSTASFMKVSEITTNAVKKPPINKVYIRLLTGGISAADKDNEWDKIIAESTLGGKITAGNDGVWHWSGVNSWTSTTYTSSNTSRASRGSSSASGYLNVLTSTSNTTQTGFRPMLLVELPLSYYLIKQNGVYYSIKPQYYDAITLNNFLPLALAGGSIPNSQDLTTYGMTDTNSLTNDMTVNSQSFKPIDKLFPNFEIKVYKSK